MHRSKLPLISLFVLVLGLAGCASDQESFPAFENRVDEGEKKVAAAPKGAGQIQEIEKMLTDLKTTRKSAARGDETDEISMTLFMDSFNDLPSPDKFDAKDCPKYRHNFNTMMKARNPEQDDLWIERAERFWKQLCP
jgi:hypothetical protein